MGVEEGDAVIAVELSDGKEQIFLGTRDGMAIRFDETDVRPMGRSAYGVRGISLRDDDEVVAMEVVREGGTLLTVAQNGYGKRTGLDEYRLQSRGGVGIINIQTTDRNGKVVGIAYVHDDDRADADQPAGNDPADEGRRHPDDRPRHPGRPPDRDGGRRHGRVGREAGGERRRGAPRRERTATARIDRPSRTAARNRRSTSAGSSFANFASSFFCPTVWKRTVIFRSSLCSSTASTVPTPNCAWRTRMPGRTCRRRTDPRPRTRSSARSSEPRAASLAAPYGLVLNS